METTSTDCAGGLVISRNKILLGLRAPDRATYPSVWDVFGGHVEADETIEEALFRELWEELSITPIKPEYLATFSEKNVRTNGERQYHLFRVASWNGPGPRLCGTEHSEMRWCTLEEAMELKLASSEYKTLFRDSMGF